MRGVPESVPTTSYQPSIPFQDDGRSTAGDALPPRRLGPYATALYHKYHPNDQQSDLCHGSSSELSVHDRKSDHHRGLTAAGVTGKRKDVAAGSERGRQLLRERLAKSFEHRFTKSAGNEMDWVTSGQQTSAGSQALSEPATRLAETSAASWDLREGAALCDDTMAASHSIQQRLDESNKDNHQQLQQLLSHSMAPPQDVAGFSQLSFVNSRLSEKELAAAYSRPNYDTDQVTRPVLHSADTEVDLNPNYSHTFAEAEWEQPHQFLFGSCITRTESPGSYTRPRSPEFVIPMEPDSPDDAGTFDLNPSSPVYPPTRVADHVQSDNYRRPAAHAYAGPPPLLVFTEVPYISSGLPRDSRCIAIAPEQTNNHHPPTAPSYAGPPPGLVFEEVPYISSRISRGS